MQKLDKISVDFIYNDGRWITLYDENTEIVNEIPLQFLIDKFIEDNEELDIDTKRFVFKGGGLKKERGN